MAAPEIKSWPLSDLVPYARNAREHKPVQIKKLARSISEFGFNQPVLATPAGEVIAGHARLLAAEELGLREVPVIVLDGLSPAQVRAYRIADNKLSDLSKWSPATLAEEFARLEAEAYDITLTGFDSSAIPELVEGDPVPEFDEMEVVEPPAPLKTARDVSGMIWELGSSYLICQDFNDFVDKFGFFSESPALALVDSELRELDPFPYERLAALGVPVIYALVRPSQIYAAAAAQGRYEVRSVINMVCPDPVEGLGNEFYDSRYCAIIYSVLSGAAGNWQGDRKQTTFWRASELSLSLPAAARLMHNNSVASQSVVCPLPSPGALFAAENTARRLYMFCADPARAVELMRWFEDQYQKPPALWADCGEASAGVFLENFLGGENA